jgi:hypothetical protein
LAAIPLLAGASVAGAAVASGVGVGVGIKKLQAMINAPSAPSVWATADFPAPIPPVTPITGRLCFTRKIARERHSATWIGPVKSNARNDYLLRFVSGSTNRQD